MKTPKIILAGLLFAAAFTLYCSLDDGDTFYGCISGDCRAAGMGGGGRGTLQNSDMRFVDSEIPTGQSGIIRNAEFSGNAIAGGSASITVTSNGPLSELYLQVGDEGGYYVRTLSESDVISEQNGEYVYSVPLRFSQELENGQLQVTVSGSTAQGAVSSATASVVQIIKRGTGALQISLSWDQLDDLDLHIVTPSGEEVFYNHREIPATSAVGKAELDTDSNAECRDPLDGKNSENAYFEAPLRDGAYTVEVHLFRKCFSAREEGARYEVTANLGGQFIEFSQTQSGRFDGSDTREVKRVIGTITIRGGVFVN